MKESISKRLSELIEEGHDILDDLEEDEEWIPSEYAVDAHSWLSSAAHIIKLITSGRKSVYSDQLERCLKDWNPAEKPKVNMLLNVLGMLEGVAKDWEAGLFGENQVGHSR